MLGRVLCCVAVAPLACSLTMSLISRLKREPSSELPCEAKLISALTAERLSKVNGEEAATRMKRKQAKIAKILKRERKKKKKAASSLGYCSPKGKVSLSGYSCARLSNNVPSPHKKQRQSAVWHYRRRLQSLNASWGTRFHTWDPKRSRRTAKLRKVVRG